MIKHIGPTAQDFYAAFELAEENHYISPIDVDGIALISIQALYEMLQAKDAQIAVLKAENAAQQAQIAALDARLATLEQAVHELSKN